MRERCGVALEAAAVLLAYEREPEPAAEVAAALEPTGAENDQIVDHWCPWDL
ncbi:hypothetical protein [Streptomyces sp. NPDC004266]|uniref:hypothetical protein n=1 Tax=Streptomyces sp. NPDC004266 TaxID=3364693 RepID=UPI0036C50A85